MPARKPILDELLDLIDVHELHIVHMPILLPFHNNIGRNTFIAHGFRVCLMLLAR
jgi:hypothetical protein